MNDLQRIEQLELSLQKLSKELNELKEACLLKEKDQETVLLQKTEEQPSPLCYQKEENQKSVSTAIESEKEEPFIRAKETAKQESIKVSEDSFPRDTPTTTQAPEKKGKAPESPSTFETKFGGKIMSIIAACLILIGIVIFGTMLYEKLTDVARATVLFAGSAAILTGGIVFNAKRPGWFSLSLTGCGFGAIYITLFLMAMSFNLISSEMLYGLIIVWLGGIGVFVFRYRSFSVAILGEIGITFSVIAGSLLFREEGKLLFLCIFFFLISLTYLFVIFYRFLHEKENEHRPYVFISVSLLNLVQLSMIAFSCNFLLNTEKTSPTISKICVIGLIYILCSILSLMFFQRRKAGLAFLQLKRPDEREVTPDTAWIFKNVNYFYIFLPILQICYVFLSNLFFEKLTNGDDTLTSLFTAMFFSIVYLLVEIFGATGKEGKGIGIVTLVCMLCYLPGMTEYARCAFLTMSSYILILGYFWREFSVRAKTNLTENETYGYVVQSENGRFLPRFISISLMLPLLYGLYEIAEKSTITFVFWCFVSLLSIMMHSLLLHIGQGEELGLLSRQKYPDFFLSYLFFVLFMYSYRLPWAFFTRIFEQRDFRAKVICFVFPVALNAMNLYGVAHKKLRNQKGRAVDTLSRILNVILFVVGMCFLHVSDAGEHPGFFALLVILTVYLCGSGLHRLYAKKTNPIAVGLYAGIKVTVYSLTLLAAFEDVPLFLFSVVLFLIAIASVFLGIKAKLVSLRIYGLVLSMLAVIKLLVIDIRHENTMQTVGCFLIAGTICFGISLLYSRLMKASDSRCMKK